MLDFSPEELVDETVALAARYLAGSEEEAGDATRGMSETTHFRWLHGALGQVVEVLTS